MTIFKEGKGRDGLFLRFGGDIPKPDSGKYVSTGIVHVDELYHYFLELEDISVGTKRLQINPEAFKTKIVNTESKEYQGFFTDSGAPFSSFPTETGNTNAYKIVMEAFDEHYLASGMEKVTPKILEKVQSFEYCYKTKLEFKNHPTLTYHFKGGDYIVRSEYVTIEIEKENCFCVAIGRIKNKGIWGAYYQQNTRLVHDFGKNVLQFRYEDCNDDHKYKSDVSVILTP